MRKEERIAVIRIFYDLIMADAVIDACEMHYYSRLQDEFGFSEQEELQAKSMTMASAINILTTSDDQAKESIIRHCKELSFSERFCARSEALLIIAILCVLGDNKAVSEVISIPKHQFNIPDSCALYIESSPDREIDEEIIARYRSIYADFKLAGFEFIYIPHIIQHYIETPDELVRQIVSFISPRLSQSGLDASIERLRSMTTVEFTKDILCNKLGMGMMRYTGPSFLIKIGNSYVDDEVYANYLKIEIRDNIETFVVNFIDRFTSILSRDVIVVSSNKEQTNQFLYTGFYKLLLDAHLLRRNVRSRIFVNPYKEDIYFPDIDTSLVGLHRKEKALYLTMLTLSLQGGISFSAPTSAKQLDAYNNRIAKMQRLYALVYGRFGGDKEKTPDLTVSEIRRPMFSLLKRCITKLSCNLYNIGDYLISKDNEGVLKINIEPEKVYVRDIYTDQYIPLQECSWLVDL